MKMIKNDKKISVLISKSSSSTFYHTCSSPFGVFSNLKKKIEKMCTQWKRLMWIGQDVGNSGAAYFMYLCLGSGKF